jgi:hypothetical protein
MEQNPVFSALVDLDRQRSQSLGLLSSIATPALVHASNVYEIPGNYSCRLYSFRPNSHLPFVAVLGVTRDNR